MPSPRPQFDVALRGFRQLRRVEVLRRGREARRHDRAGRHAAARAAAVRRQRHRWPRSSICSGAFRWGIEFDWAVEYLSSRRIDVRAAAVGPVSAAGCRRGIRAGEGQDPQHQGPGRRSLSDGRQAMLTKTSFTIRLHPADDVVIARPQLVGRHAAARRERHRRRPRAARPQGRDAGHRGRRAGEALQPDHRLRQPRHRARRARAPAQPRDGRRSIATTRSAPTSKPTQYVDAGRRRSWASSARRRPRRDAQLHRHPVDGELLGDGRARHRRRIHARARSRQFPNVDGVVALTHGSRLRHGHAGRGHAGAAPHARRLRARTPTSPAC